MAEGFEQDVEAIWADSAAIVKQSRARKEAVGVRVRTMPKQRPSSRRGEVFGMAPSRPIVSSDRYLPLNGDRFLTGAALFYSPSRPGMSAMT